MHVYPILLSEPRMKLLGLYWLFIAILLRLVFSKGENPRMVKAEVVNRNIDCTLITIKFGVGWVLRLWFFVVVVEVVVGDGYYVLEENKHWMGEK